MRRPLLIGLLAFGTVAGYASGFAHLRHGCHHWGCERDSWSDARPLDAPPPMLVAPQAAPAPVVINAAPAPAPQPMQALVIPIVINPAAPGAAAPAQPIVVTLPAQAIAISPAPIAPAAAHP